MARNQTNDTINLDLEGYHIATINAEDGIVYNFYYNPNEKDRSKAWKKVPR